MMPMSNRRLAQRFNLKIPLVFCPMNTPLERGHEVKSINISQRGVYFKTEHPVFVGLPVRVLLQMPSECGGKPAMPVIFTGRVSHVAAKRR
jgi:hypothetical protein